MTFRFLVQPSPAVAVVGGCDIARGTCQVVIPRHYFNFFENAYPLLALEPVPYTA